MRAQLFMEVLTVNFDNDFDENFILLKIKMIMMMMRGHHQCQPAAGQSVPISGDQAGTIGKKTKINQNLFQRKTIFYQLLSPARGLSCSEGSSHRCHRSEPHRAAWGTLFRT